MNWRVILNAVALYIGIYLLHAVLMSSAGNVNFAFLRSQGWQIANEVLGYLTWLIPGYIGGRRSRSRGLAGGAVIGAAGAVAAMVIMSLAFKQGMPGLYEGVHWAIVSAFFCSLAGGVGELHARRDA